MTNIKRVSNWRPDPGAYDPGARVCVFTFEGETYTGRSLHPDGPDQWPITVRRDGAYVTTVSNWRLLPEQLGARLSREV